MRSEDHPPVETADLPVLCGRCSRPHAPGRACHPRVRWLQALGVDLAGAVESFRGVATQVRGLLDDLRGDRDPPVLWRRIATGGGIAAALALLRAVGVL